MLSKLPLWIGTSAFFLAFAAGCINVFVLSSTIHLAVTHHSGTATNLVLSLSRGDFVLAYNSLLIILSFVAGSALSGYIIRDSHLKLGRRYGVSLLLESCLILLAWALFDSQPYAGLLLLAGACGLQNAMATTYSGAVVRTTHLTGLLTDMGVLIGNRLAGIPMPERKFRLLGDILAGFMLGGLASGLLSPILGTNVLIVPAAISGGSALVYFVYYKFFSQPW